jgi:ectoine hydroxylase-related dioxygenase (phytanoyl-CoA dioxygenase family)
MLSAESGELLLFLSTLEHSVLENKSEEDRISISFNTFTKGSIGSIEDLTYIPIDRCKE